MSPEKFMMVMESRWTDRRDELLNSDDEVEEAEEEKDFADGCITVWLDWCDQLLLLFVSLLLLLFLPPFTSSPSCIDFANIFACDALLNGLYTIVSGIPSCEFMYLPPK